VTPLQILSPNIISWTEDSKAFAPEGLSCPDWRAIRDADAKAIMVGLALFPQLFGLAFCSAVRTESIFVSVSFIEARICWLKRPGPGLFFGRKRALSSLLAKLSQLFARRFAAREALLDDRANLLLLIVGEIQFPAASEGQNLCPVRRRD